MGTSCKGESKIIDSHTTGDQTSPDPIRKRGAISESQTVGKPPEIYVTSPQRSNVPEAQDILEWS